MGTSTRKITVAAACCALLLGPQLAFADGNSWLERLTSLSRAFIPDINLASYLDRDNDSDSDEEAAWEGEAEAASGGLWQLEAPADASSLSLGQRYSLTVVDADLENTWSSAGVSLLTRDAVAESKVGGLGRSAVSTSPTPMYGLNLNVMFSSRWKLGVRGRFLDTVSGDVDSSMSTYSAAFEYTAKDRVSLGIGYEQFETYADTQLQNVNGYVNYSYSGPRVFTTFRF
jgi:hypothetical protein